MTEPTRLDPPSDTSCETLIALLQREASDAELVYQRSNRDQNAARRAGQLTHAVETMRWLCDLMRQPSSSPSRLSSLIAVGLMFEHLRGMAHEAHSEAFIKVLTAAYDTGESDARKWSEQVRERLMPTLVEHASPAFIVALFRTDMRGW